MIAARFSVRFLYLSAHQSEAGSYDGHPARLAWLAIIFNFLWRFLEGRFAMSSCSLATLVAHVLAEQSPGNELHISMRSKAGKLLTQVFYICKWMWFAFDAVGIRGQMANTNKNKCRKPNLCALFAAPKAKGAV
mgnify:CR=1 FL=1